MLYFIVLIFYHVLFDGDVINAAVRLIRISNGCVCYSVN